MFRSSHLCSKLIFTIGLPEFLFKHAYTLHLVDMFLKSILTHDISLSFILALLFFLI